MRILKPDHKLQITDYKLKITDHRLQITNTVIMKTSRSTLTKQNKQGPSKKPRPEIRDDIDSRKQKEAGYTGDKSKKGDRKKMKKK
jgi:hypothetical protein